LCLEEFVHGLLLSFSGFCFRHIRENE